MYLNFAQCLYNKTVFKKKSSKLIIIHDTQEVASQHLHLRRRQTHNYNLLKLRILWSSRRLKHAGITERKEMNRI